METTTKTAELMKLYRGVPEGGDDELKPRHFSAVFFSESPEAAAQYGNVHEYVVNMGGRPILNIDDAKTPELVKEFSGRGLENPDDLEDVTVEYFMFPFTEWTEFLQSKGYSGTRIGHDVALFNTQGVMKTAADYGEMFNGLIQGVTELNTFDPKALSGTPWATVDAFKTEIKSEINWAKQHLKKQDRIVWYLRIERLGLAHGMFYDYPELKKKYYEPMFNQFQKQTGMEHQQAITAMGTDTNRLQTQLDHFLSLPIPEIQNTIFDKQSPDDLLRAFKAEETTWKEKTKGALQPQQGDKIVVQFQDGWAWWKLGRGYCPEEARAMGHCGNVNGKYNTDERILSLRKPVQFGKEKRWEPFLTFILDGDGWIGEMKGRGNAKPAARYHPYIIGLLERTDITKGIKGGGYLPSHNFSLNDLDWEDQQRLEKINPNMISCVNRLRQLKGKPDAALVERIEKTGDVPGYYDPRLTDGSTTNGKIPGHLLQTY